MRPPQWAASRRSCLSRAGLTSAGGLKLWATLRVVAGIFMDITGDFPEGHVRSASRLDWTWTAVTRARAAKDGSAVMDPAGGREQLACGADVDIALLVECKVAARERSIFSPAFIPDRNVRRDAGTNQPAQQFGCAVGRISGETFGLCDPTWSVLSYVKVGALNGGGLT
jgi:hypothetical protein